MKHLRRFAGLLLAFACLCAGARAQTLDRAPGESDLSFATRALGLPKDAEPHTTSAAWNGVPTLFVDYKTNDADPERPLVALQRQAAGRYHTIQVTLGEHEGGTPDVLAIGFANADRDPERELIVILAWPQVHYDFSGTLYEVRLFDAPQARPDRAEAPAREWQVRRRMRVRPTRRPRRTLSLQDRGGGQGRAEAAGLLARLDRPGHQGQRLAGGDFRRR